MSHLIWKLIISHNVILLYQFTFRNCSFWLNSLIICHFNLCAYCAYYNILFLTQQNTPVQSFYSWCRQTMFMLMFSIMSVLASTGTITKNHYYSNTWPKVWPKNMIKQTIYPYLFDFLAHPTEPLSWQHCAVSSLSLCIQLPCGKQNVNKELKYSEILGLHVWD